MAIENPSFETGNLTGWTVEVVGTSELGTAEVVSEADYADSGSYALKIGAHPPDAWHDTAVVNSYKFYPTPGSTITVAARVRSTKDKKGNAFGSIGLKYTYSDGSTGIAFSRELATNEMRDGFVNLNFSASPPSNVVSAQLVLRGRLYQTDRWVYFDSCVMSGDEITGETVELRFPTNGSVYQEGNVIPFRVNIRTGITVTALNYIVTNTATADVTTIPGTGADFKADYSLLPKASYSVVAQATLSGGLELTTSAHTFTVGDAAVIPQREYKASNAYTYLIMRDFNQLAATMPATAVVTGAQLEVDYRVTFLIRCKDKDVDTVDAARYEAAFQIAPTGVLSAQMLAPNGGAYSAVGNAVTGKQPFVMSDFSVVDNGASESKRWVALDSGSYKMVLGAEDSVFGLQEIQAGNFLDYAMGLRFYPQLGTVPSYTDDGDMCVRVRLDKVRLKVYFDGGSIEYYFVDPQNPNVAIKAQAAAAYVQEGSLKFGNASGFFQLLPELTYVNSAVPPAAGEVVFAPEGRVFCQTAPGEIPGTAVMTDLNGNVDPAFNLRWALDAPFTKKEVYAGMQRGNYFLFGGNFSVYSGVFAQHYVMIMTDATGLALGGVPNPYDEGSVNYVAFDGRGLVLTVTDGAKHRLFAAEISGTNSPDTVDPDGGRRLVVKLSGGDGDVLPWPLHGPDGTFFPQTYPTMLRSRPQEGTATEERIYLHYDRPWISTQWSVTNDWPADMYRDYGETVALPALSDLLNPPPGGGGKPVHMATPVWPKIYDGVSTAAIQIQAPRGEPPTASFSLPGVYRKVQGIALDSQRGWLYFGFALGDPANPSSIWRIGRVSWPGCVLDTVFTFDSVQNETAFPDGNKEIIGLQVETDSGNLITRRKGNTYTKASIDGNGTYTQLAEFTTPASASYGFIFSNSSTIVPPEAVPLPVGTPYIYADYDIHAAIPATEKNWIGKVAYNMRYNGLPTYDAVEGNRSRYMFISANFYGDPDLDSLYGANGVFRAFSYNGDYFYHIATQPDADKDKARHLAYHHGHLALGFQSGRVDLSVVGEPYNFDGAEGASSWAIGDEVTGLLPLSGTMLGIFGRKSITGLSGTTVDNFSTQTISPKLGAVEYTVTDMGFPVYANAYGIYTLSQTADYGDFLGTPMSQQVSPWLRPRLVRSSNSNKEVVVAWPVRSKNQYKLAFADGYVLTMTMNYGNQSAPTFSKQKYFDSYFDQWITGGTSELPAAYDLERTSMVPAAVSSELDDSGEERIHFSPKTERIVLG